MSAIGDVCLKEVDCNICVMHIHTHTTIRCATTCLLMTLCFFYPSWLLLWQCLVALDISSHWVQMYSALVVGETSHKVTDLSANPIMRYYYMRVSFEGMHGNTLSLIICSKFKPFCYNPTYGNYSCVNLLCSMDSFFLFVLCIILKRLYS